MLPARLTTLNVLVEGYFDYSLPKPPSWASFKGERESGNKARTKTT